MMQKNCKKMTETLAYGYSSERPQRELSNEYQYDRVYMVFQKSLHYCSLDENSLTILRVDIWEKFEPKPSLTFTFLQIPAVH